MKFGKLGKRKGRPASSFLKPASGADLRQNRERRITLFVTVIAFAVMVAAITRGPVFEDDTFDIASDTKGPAEKTWKAEFPFQSEDIEATKRAREDAAASIPDTYYIDYDKVDSQIRSMREQIEALRGQRDALDRSIRAALLASNSSQDESAIVSDVVAKMTADLRSAPPLASVENPTTLAPWLQPDPRCIPKRVFETLTGKAAAKPAPVKELSEPTLASFSFQHDLRLEQLATDGLKAILDFGVLIPSASENQVQAPSQTNRTVLIVRAGGGLAPSNSEMKQSEIPDREKAAKHLETAIHDLTRTMESREIGGEAIPWTELQQAAFALAKTGLTGTLMFDRVATEGAREAARAKVQPVMRSIEHGKTLQRDGDYWTDQSRQDVAAYLGQMRGGDTATISTLGAVAANMILVGLTLALLIRSLPKLISKNADLSKNLMLVLLLMSGVLVVGRVSSYFEPTGYAIPTTAASILLAILANGRLALLMGGMTAALVSMQFDYSWGVLIVGNAMTFAGVLAIFKVRRRSDMTRAAFKATTIGVITTVAVILATDSLFSDIAVQRLGLILLHGLACSLIVPGLLSPLERLFGITTDIQLLEYSDLNNEVLSKLAIEVPATYAHSLMLGQLAEAAADAVGANGLLARVCAYYHDIGKMRRPDYFSENQTGVNIHDGLPARLSARAIASHVVEGAEMAREFHLPKPLHDGILEHHGTNLISFFYQQALEQNKHGDVREEDFRYPGPKPRHRETAILMICDAVESGVRSIKNPTEERVREFVDKIITARAEDRQFDDCDLTLKDLDTIGEVVTKRMLTALHTRIAYPSRMSERKASNVVSIAGGKE